MKKVQLPEDFLYVAWELCLRLNEHRSEIAQIDPELISLGKLIFSMANEKFEAINRREAFSEYKRSEVGSDIREQKRNSYLDMVGVHTDWTTKSETPWEILYF